MEARPSRLTLVFAAWLLAAPITASFVRAAEYRTPNFIAYAADAGLAKEVAMTAEQWRVRLAKEWLGHELPPWKAPCPITVKVGQIGAGGATTFNFDRGEVFGWRMNVQGTRERILDSVVPHEVSHTIFASHFRRPLPRWADEGAATLAEHESEQRRQELTLKQVWDTAHKIPLGSLLGMTEYPTEMRDVMTLYAEGYSLANFLEQVGGKARFLAFIDDAERTDWDAAIRKHYSLGGVSELDKKWASWVVAGSPPVRRDGAVIAAAEPRPAARTAAARTAAADGTIILGQSPDEEGPQGRRAASPAPGGNAADLFAELAEAAPAAPVQVAALSAGPGRPQRRPAPLETFIPNGRGSLRAAATETTFQPADGNAAALPRTIRAAAQGDSRPDFFGHDGDPGRASQTLGPGGFPAASR